ncbi:hypothetical protein BH11PSE9_BH11PSE9_18310 [soil metagenome]
MRTRIVIDDGLMEEAMRLSGLTTKRELVDRALKEFVAVRKRLDLRDLRGVDGLQLWDDHKRIAKPAV